MISGNRSIFRLFAGCSLLAVLAACDRPVDSDLRGGFDQFSTSPAALQAASSRPAPDERGIISYPDYQVAVARRGDTPQSVAQRVGVNAADLARYNGLQLGDLLREGEVLALPNRVAEPSPPTGAGGFGSPMPAGQVDISQVAGSAIDRVSGQEVAVSALPPAATSEPLAQTGTTPVQHQVARGETAFTVARTYNVPVRTLADWNGLDQNFTIREGQYLMIPLAGQEPPVRTASATAMPPSPPAPAPSAPPAAAQPQTPPPAARPAPVAPASSDVATSSPAPSFSVTASASPSTATSPAPAPAVTPAPQPAPQPAARVEPQPPAPQPVAPAPSASASAPSTGGGMSYPVQGSIIREFAAGKSDGIDIAASAGTPVKAAKAGTVAAVTSDNVIVVRHDGNLVTIYSSVDGISVQKGDSVSQGQAIAQSAGGHVHFEVRQGMTAVDPTRYLK